jgi:hypothetical protein
MYQEVIFLYITPSVPNNIKLYFYVNLNLDIVQQACFFIDTIT